MLGTTTEIQKKLLTLGQNGYFNIYSKIIEIMDRCDELSTASCPEFMKAGIEVLAKNIPAEVLSYFITH